MQRFNPDKHFIKLIFPGIVLFCALLIVHSCSSNKKTNLPEETIMSGPDSIVVSLAIGEWRSLEKPPVTIGFDKVLEDSRCPTGARCVWEGNAKISVWLQKSTNDTLFAELNSTLEPKEMILDNHLLRFVSLEPYPQLGVKVDSTAYRAEVLVKRLKRR